MRLRSPSIPIRTAKDRLLEHYLVTEGPSKAGKSNSAKNLALQSVAERIADGWITLRQAMAYLCVSHVSLGRLIKAGRIRAFKPDYGTHTVLVSLDDTRKVLADSARAAGMFDDCDNPALAQGEAQAGAGAGRKKRKKNSSPKSA